ISFVDVFTARAFEDQEPKFSVTSLIVPGSENDKKIEAEIQRVAKAKWGEKAAAKLKAIIGNNMKYCYRPEGEKDYAGYEGKKFIKASNTSRPTVIDRDRTPLTKEDGKPYSGCVANVSLDIYVNSKDGISASLKGLQFVEDGDAFTGGGVANPNDFEDLTAANDDEYAAREFA
ncbi:ssDNA-binding protein, partial [Leclercia adecarboxylata]|uniref:ssDNA-binding protein n=1 Tax=Leclercia adecarboxylata TaxID=83655 RepID=UPI003D2DC911